MATYLDCDTETTGQITGIYGEDLFSANEEMLINSISYLANNIRIQRGISVARRSRLELLCAQLVEEMSKIEVLERLVTALLAKQPAHKKVGRPLGKKNSKEGGTEDAA